MKKTLPVKPKNRFILALSGFKQALATEGHLRFDCLVALVVLAVSWHLGRVKFCIVLILCGLVISMELVNTAIEYLVDFISPEYNEKAGMIKDISSAAVLTVCVLSVLVAVVLFF